MRKVTLISGILTIAMCYAFLYLGNIYSAFHTSELAKGLGVIFEIAIVLSTVLFIIIFKEKKIHFYLTIFAFIFFLLHLLLVFTVGFQKQYSYAMDAVISIIYLVMISRNWEMFFMKK